MKAISLGILAIVVCIVLALALGFSVSHKSTSTVSISTSTVATSTETYTVTLSYPRFGIEKADAAVQSVVDSAVNDFESLPPNPTPVTAKNELIGEYQTINSGPDFLSAKMEIYQYTGGAHGNTILYGLNFHPDGTAVTLEEALALVGKDLHEISIEAEKQLNQRFGLVQFPEGASPEAKNYSTFVIGTSTVTFIFQQYQVEAYVAGAPEISFARVK
jgi:hypothetical protein